MAITEIEDLIIIGGGPAGLSAGIYASRARLNTLLIEKLAPGGLAMTTHLIENYPGFPYGISGPELMRGIEAQATRFGLKFAIEEVISLDIENEVKIVKTATHEYKVYAVIIATGAQPKKLGIPGEDKFMGKGVSYCAICDGPLFKDKNIVVIGCGNSGLQEGLFLLKFVSRITFIEFLPYMTADKILQEQIQKERRVSLFLGHTLVSINGDDCVSSITIKDKTTDKEKVIETEGVFIYAGLNPNTKFLQGVINLDSNGYVITNENLETSVNGSPRRSRGIFAAGDVRMKLLRQVATSVGDGALAAFMVEKYLERRQHG